METLGHIPLRDKIKHFGFFKNYIIIINTALIDATHVTFIFFINATPTSSQEPIENRKKAQGCQLVLSKLERNVSSTQENIANLITVFRWDQTAAPAASLQNLRTVVDLQILIVKLSQHGKRLSDFAS